MSKQKLSGTFSTNNQLFEDLEKYREFCVEYGYKFDEANLYDMRNYSFQQFNKAIAHKNFKDQWLDDARKMLPPEDFRDFNI